MVLVDALRLPLAAASRGCSPAAEPATLLAVASLDVSMGFTNAWLKGSVPRLRSCGARA